MPYTTMLFLQASIALLSAGFCLFLCYTRALHMFQLNSYQRTTHSRWLTAHRSAVLNPRVLLPAALIFVALSSPPLFWLAPMAALLYVFFNPRPVQKKPLVMTPRVKRMSVTAVLLNVAVFVLALLTIVYLSAPYKAIAAAAVCALVLFQHLLVMIYSAVNAPIEHAVNNRYINEARQILRNSPNLTVIGITGSFGKTSTKHFLHALLSRKFSVYSSPGNYNTTLGAVRSVREGLRSVHEIFICEMGARHVGDIEDICRLVLPDFGIITSIGEQHIESFKSLENVSKTKRELADSVFKKGGTVFLNFDSVPVKMAEYSGKTITYGINGENYTVSDTKIDKNGSSFTVTVGTEAERFTTKLLGRANVQNLAGAIAVAHHLGVSLSEAKIAVSRLEGVPGRLELLPGDGMSIINDAYNSNPEGAKIALETLSMCSGLRIVITPGLVELGEHELRFNYELGEYAAQHCDVLITVGTQQRAHQIRLGAGESGMQAEVIHAADTVQQALALARSLPGEDKMVLLLNDLTDNY